MLPSPVNGSGDRRSTAFHPFSHHHHQQRPSPESSSPSLPTARSMEEVWKDINLPCLHVPNFASAANSAAGASSSPSLRSLILQDFLNRPSSDQPSSSSLGAASPSSPPHPATVLSLNPGPDFFFPTDQHDGDSPRGHLAGGGPFDALASSVLASFGKKRISEGGDNGGTRHKRMMKNRESAARSRARKQAYINQLQLEIDRLNEENAVLRYQQEKQIVLQDEPVDQLPKKHHLQRTSTAPF